MMLFNANGFKTLAIIAELHVYSKVDNIEYIACTLFILKISCPLCASSIIFSIPRQRYDTAYDNPVYDLHIVGNDLTMLDRVAGHIREQLDRTSHIETGNGTINTLSIDPPVRSERKARPRYDVVLTINAEVIRQ